MYFRGCRINGCIVVVVEVLGWWIAFGCSWVLVRKYMMVEGCYLLWGSNLGCDKSNLVVEHNSNLFGSCEKQLEIPPLFS